MMAESAVMGLHIVCIREVNNDDLVLLGFFTYTDVMVTFEPVYLADCYRVREMVCAGDARRRNLERDRSWLHANAVQLEVL